MLLLLDLRVLAIIGKDTPKGLLVKDNGPFSG